MPKPKKKSSQKEGEGEEEGGEDGQVLEYSSASALQSMLQRRVDKDRFHLKQPMELAVVGHKRYSAL